MTTSRAASRQQRKDHEDAETLRFETLVVGDAANFPSYGDTVGIHYIAHLASSGVEFDNTYRRGQMFYFILGVGQVIPGLDEVVPKLSQGQKISVSFTPALAYGVAGFPPGKAVIIRSGLYVNKLFV
jgi:peptidylprolyl isomerase